MKIPVSKSKTLTIVAALGLLGQTTTASSQGYVSDPSSGMGMEFDLNYLQREQLLPFVYRGERDQKEAFYIANIFARCAVGLNMGRARGLLDRALSAEGSHILDEQRYYNRLRGCAVRHAYIDRDFMRGSLATHVLLADPQTADAAPVRNIDELTGYLKSVEVAKQSIHDALTSTQLGYECRTAIAPDAAYDVLEYDPGSPEEAQRLAELERKTPLCDRLFRGEALSHWFQRAFVARGLYHWNQYSDTVLAGA